MFVQATQANLRIEENRQLERGNTTKNFADFMALTPAEKKKRESSADKKNNTKYSVIEPDDGATIKPSDVTNDTLRKAKKKKESASKNKDKRGKSKDKVAEEATPKPSGDTKRQSRVYPEAKLTSDIIAQTRKEQEQQNKQNRQELQDELPIKRAKQIHEEKKKVIHKQYQRHLEAEYTGNGFFLINPASRFRKNWDILIICALIFTATVLPFEVSFLKADWNALFYVNRLVDGIFTVDILINLMSPYLDNGAWVVNHKLIFLSYLHGWLFVDVVSVLPFDTLGLLMEDENFARLKILRVIRLLRLAKLLRIFRASRILKRWETKMSMSYSVLTLANFMFSMIMLAHWLACLFKLVTSLEMPEATEVDGVLVVAPHLNWVSNYFEIQLGLAPDEYTHWDEYSAALYWAVMTVTTIGYGDVVAKTTYERYIAVFSMMIGGSMYAYIVGAVCGTVASMNELTTKFRRTIDDLNNFMEAQHLPNDMRIRLREYFHYTEQMQKSRHYHNLLMEMSPDLRGEVSLTVNAHWITLVPFITCSPKDERKAFITALAVELTSLAFPPHERIMKPGQPATEMYIIERGIVMLHRGSILPVEDSEEMNGGPQGEGVDVIKERMRAILSSTNQEILNQGKSFGHDMILSDARRRYLAVALTYVEVHSISKEALNKVLSENHFPITRKNLRRYALKLAFQVKFVHVSRLIHAQNRAAAAEEAAAAEAKRLNAMAGDREARATAMASMRHQPSIKEQIIQHMRSDYHNTNNVGLDGRQVDASLQNAPSPQPFSSSSRARGGAMGHSSRSMRRLQDVDENTDAFSTARSAYDASDEKVGNSGDIMRKLEEISRLLVTTNERIDRLERGKQEESLAEVIAATKDRLENLEANVYYFHGYGNAANDDSNDNSNQHAAEELQLQPADSDCTDEEDNIR